MFFLKRQKIAQEVTTRPTAPDLAVSSRNLEDDSGPDPQIICFTPGTLIATRHGQRSVEDLQSGDLILTRDNSHQPLAWVGRRELALTQSDDIAVDPPVLIRAGALDEAFPQNDLLVSADHHVLIQSERAQALFGEREVLVPAQFLTKLAGIDQLDARPMTYLHLLFERHEIVMANGTWSESFQPNPAALMGLRRAAKDDVLALFPELAAVKGVKNYDSARRLLQAYEAHMLTLDDT